MRTIKAFSFYCLKIRMRWIYDIDGGPLNPKENDWEK